MKRRPTAMFRPMFTKLLSGCVGMALIMQMETVAGSSSETFKYPKAKKVDQVDEYHGTRVADPYR